MKRNRLTLSTLILAATIMFFSCDNFLNSNLEYKDALEEEVNYAKAANENIVVGYNNDEYGTVGSGVLNYSITEKVGYAFNVSFNLKATAGNFVGWKAYTQYDSGVPENCIPLADEFIEFLDNSQYKTTATVKILKPVGKQIRLIPEVSAFPVMEVCLPAALASITPTPASFNPPQTLTAVTPEQQYSITATTSVDYGFPEDAEDCWKVYRKDSLGNEIEITDGNKITIAKSTGTLLANGKSQSTIYITVDNDFSGRFYVSPNLVTYPSMNVEVDEEYSDLVKMSHSGIVSMAKGTPYTLAMQTDPSVGFAGWRLFKRGNTSPYEETDCFVADSTTTTDIKNFTAYSDEYIEVKDPSYEVTETGKTAGKINSSVQITLKEDMDQLTYSYFIKPVLFKYPVVNIMDPDGYSSAGKFSLAGAGYLDNDSVRMMMNSYEYTITYRTTEDYSFADTKWIVYETGSPDINLADVENETRIDIAKSSVTLDEAGGSSCSISVTLNHNFGTSLNIKPVIVQKPSMNIAFADGTPIGVILSAGGNTITSGTESNKTVKMATSKVYTATVNVPAGLSFEGWRLEKVTASNNRVNWITESTKSTIDIVDSANLEFDTAAASERPEDFIRIFNAKYEFQNEGRNAGTTKATVDISFKRELEEFSINLIPVIKIVPSVNFVLNGADYGTLSPADERNLYLGTKIDLTYKSTRTATAGKEIWRVKILNESGGYDDYSENVGYTENDLTSALKDASLKEKDIIIYNNDKETEVQPNAQGEYITTKTAVLYVNKVPANSLQISVTPEIYNTIRFNPGTAFEATSYDAAVFIPKDMIFTFEIKTKEGFKATPLGTQANGANTEIATTSITTASNGVTTLKGTIKSTKNNGDAVVITPIATALSKVNFASPALLGSVNFATEKESAGTTSPSSSEFIYQVGGNSIGIKFETTSDYTYEGYAAGSVKFTDISSVASSADPYVITTESLNQAKAKAVNAKIIIHDVSKDNITDGQGLVKNKVTGTLTVVNPDETVTVKPLVKGKPGFQMSIAAADQGSISPSVKKSIFIGEDYDISYLSSSGYGFDRWTVSNDGTEIPVLTLSDAAGSAGTSAAEFVVDLDSVQELAGSNSLANINATLGLNGSKLLAVIYRTSKVESQATEGVETVAAKFRIVKDTASAIVVSPVTYKHSYFYLHLENSADGRYSPASRTLMKAGKDYDIEYIFNGTTYTTYSFQVSSASSFATAISDFVQLSQSSITDWSTYSSKKFVIYGISNSINESNNVATRKAKIRLIKELSDGIEIHIRPSVDNIQKISFIADTSDISKLQINNTISTTGSINSYPMIDHNLMPYKSYSISATPVNGKAIYSEPGKMWNIVNSSGNDIKSLYDFAFTGENYNDSMVNNNDAVFYNCRLEYVGNNLYKACAEVIIKKDEVNGFTIIPNTYTLPEVNFNSPVTASGSKKGTCLVNEAVPPTSSKLFIGKEYDFVYEADDGYHISSFELYSNSVLKKAFTKTDTSYTNTEVKITELSFSGDNKLSGKITFLKEAVAAYSFNCNVEPGKPGPVLNIGSGKSNVQYKAIQYKYDGSRQSNETSATTTSITSSKVFNLATAQERGYQGSVSSTGGYPIADSAIKFYINASDTQYTDGIHTPSKVIITERLFYLHPGMLMDYSLNHDYSDFDVIGAEGLQLFDEVGNYTGDSKYQNAKFGLEKTTVINATSLTSYTKTSNTISGYISYANKISYGGIHQYTVSVLDNEGNESNKFVVYLDVPRTPRTGTEENFITACLNAKFWDEGIYIDWTGLGSNPLGENMQVVYSAGQVKASTKEAKLSSGVYKTPLRMYPANSTFKYEICLCDSNGYATVFQESKSYTTERVYEGDLVVRDSQTYKLYYISVDLYLKRKGTLEPVAVVVSKTGKYGAQNNRIIGAGLFDAGDYPFTYSKIWYNQPQTTLYDGRTQFQTWKNNAPYYSSNTYTAANKTVLFNESNFPAIYKATHYGDMLKTKSGVLSSGWYLPDVFEVYGMREPARFKRINRTLTAIDGQPFEYNTGYWSAEYTSPGSGGPRNLLIMTPSNDETAAVAEYDFGYSIEEHHVRAVFDFTDLAEPWPNN
ncbi:hypothetical protein [Treponema sp.]|uniref:hypothetical protein n=1 Tax=Treponema sp. TaxID=166 RepID=UPI00298DDFFC|nr:hypothetical protein [Treponema sp.]MCQ2240832.1 hypothetical protein [Treponema sp.]